ncbi:NGFI-A-binding protein homolog [Macrosteles quadrilineatus]|uniref:NGFI-A-binding protein homolog n=1 Tax=Macrosteles quadrilineatus TaxID=74068 RepID=UPI0023E21D5D|nr:NGFI-A-binding protein homolog [Macrosteles quadrilineatus]
MDYPGDASSSTGTVTTPPPPLHNAAPKILSRNTNGTLVLTSTPNNEAELQLYRVMQRASLLAYYDTLLEMGGDDVQQLCDAGEEEFLEIMALVGMASKPLHVRRLQKALQEWLTNPVMFQTPLVPGSFSRVAPSYVAPVSPSPVTCKLDPLLPHSPSPNNTQVMAGEVASSIGSPGRGPATSTSPGPGPPSPLQLTPVLSPAQVQRLADSAANLVKRLPQLETTARASTNPTKKKANKELESVLAMDEDDPQKLEQIRKFAAIYGRFDCKRKPEKPLTLHEVSVNEAAAQICRLVPALLMRRDELFPLARQVVRDSGYHYSKGHSKAYTVSHSSRSMLGYSNGENGSKRPRLDPPQSPTDLTEESARLRRQERLEQIGDELHSVEDLLTAGSAPYQVEALQARQTQLLQERTELMRYNSSLHMYRRTSSCGRVSSSFDSEKLDTDDTDSQLSFSNASSPSQDVGDSRDSLTREADLLSPKPKQNESEDEFKIVNEMIVVPSKTDTEDFEDPYFKENKVQVIASSGGNIIAVANPALSMSPAIVDPVLLKKEAVSPKLSS